MDNLPAFGQIFHAFFCSICRTASGFCGFRKKALLLFCVGQSVPVFVGGLYSLELSNDGSVKGLFGFVRCRGLLALSCDQMLVPVAQGLDLCAVLGGNVVQDALLGSKCLGGACVAVKLRRAGVHVGF